MFRCIGAACLVLIFVGAEDKKAASIEGKITLGGAVVAKGKVSFYPAVGKAIEVEIKDGAYSVQSVPTGQLRIVVKGDGIPAKYADKATSGLTFEAKPGKSSLDIVIEK